MKASIVLINLYVDFNIVCSLTSPIYQLAMNTSNMTTVSTTTLPSTTTRHYLTCYQCHYSMDRGTPRGDPQCMDPFMKSDYIVTTDGSQSNKTVQENKSDLKVVECRYGYCQKRWLELDEMSFSLTRLCVWDCHNLTHANHRQELCCRTTLCNGSSSLFPLIFWHFVVICISYAC